MTERKESPDTEALRRHDKAIAPAPWTTTRGEIHCDGCCCDIESEEEIGTEYLSCMIQSCGMEQFAIPHAEAIVAFRNAMPSLLADLEDKRAEVERLKGCIKTNSSAWDILYTELEDERIRSKRLRDENERLRKLVREFNHGNVVANHVPDAVHCTTCRELVELGEWKGRVRRELIAFKNAALKSKEPNDG